VEELEAARESTHSVQFNLKVPVTRMPVAGRIPAMGLNVVARPKYCFFNWTATVQGGLFRPCQPPGFIPATPSKLIRFP
jgi:hypothetical protein